MGKSYIPVMLFSDAIKVDPHSASKVEHLKPISIKDFANAAPVSLEICEETGELLVSKGVPGTASYEFIEGPEWIGPLPG